MISKEVNLDSVDSDYGIFPEKKFLRIDKDVSFAMADNDDGSVPKNLL